MDAKQVKELLNGRAEEVCQMLLPAGKRVAGHWVVGNVCNKPGDSTKVTLQGTYAGNWRDFAPEPGMPEHGDLFGIWQAQGRSFKDALEDAKRFLGIHEYAVKKASEYVKKPAAAPVGPAGTELAKALLPLRPGKKAHMYLTQARMLTEETLAKYGVGESADGESAGFPYYGPSGELHNIKWLKIDREKVEGPDGMVKWKKRMWWEVNGKGVILFGLQAMPEKKRALSLVLTEGEIDALSWAQYGEFAVSVPAGCAGKHDWIEPMTDWLDQFEAIYLSLDEDEPGQTAVPTIAQRLGRHRCYQVALPAPKAEGQREPGEDEEERRCKDANECLQAGIDFEGMGEALVAAKDMDPPELRRPSEFREETWREFFPVDGKEPGDTFPWPMPFRFREKEGTVWTGYAKHGKGVAIGQCLLHFAASAGKISCIASLEMAGRKTVQNMIRQLIGKQKPDNEEEYNKALEWLDQYLLIYNVVGTVRVEALMATFEYAARKYGVKHFVIDSLMKLNIAEDDNKGQQDLLNLLCAFGERFDCHWHLVAHAKKPDAKHPEKKYWPDKYSVRGSAHIVDLAFNVICVWRNKEKADEVMIAETLGDEGKLEELKNKNDALIVVQAQRGGDGDEPVKQLWYDQHGGWQFRDEPRLVRKNILAGDRSGY